MRVAVAHAEADRGAAGAADPIVALRDVYCVHRTAEGDAAALQGTTLDVARGEIVCVLGPSGAGKSTMLRVIAGLQVPSAGIVNVLGRDVGRLGARSRARLRHDQLGFLGQHTDSALPPDLPVGQTVALPLALRGVNADARRSRAAELLDTAALSNRIGALPGELSGGERQRVALCAALAHRPALLLADEPTGELDDSSAQTVRGLIAELARASGATVIVVSHDAASAALADRALRIRDGRIVEDRRDGEHAFVVGRGGWLQLPPKMLGQAGISDRARAQVVSGGVLVTPACDGRTGAPSPPGATRPAPLSVARWQPAQLEVRALRQSRGRRAARRQVIDDLTLSLAAGRMTAVTGRSGAGKTTLLRILGTLDPPDSGELLIDGRSLGGCDTEQLANVRRERIGYMPQEPSPVGFLGAEENVVLALRVRGWDTAPAAERAAVVLGRVGLAQRARQRVSRLSAGEGQRVALARALASARGLLIVDEPTSRLDEANAAAIAELLVAAARQDSQTVVCATHDPEVIRHADEVVAL